MAGTAAPARRPEGAGAAARLQPGGPGPRRGGAARTGAAVTVGAVLLALACLASLALGARDTGLGVVLEALTAPVPGDGDHVVVQARVPRTVAGLLVGAALGLARAGLQGVARNPLADTGILGINAGAALAVVAATTLFGVRQLTGFIWFAFAGAAAAGVLAYAVRARAGRARPP